MESKGERFERVTREVQMKIREHVGFADVEGSKDYTGKETGNTIQIDATAYTEDGRHILIECRNRSRAAGRRDMGAFWLDIQDIGATGGIFVSAQGFAKGAKNTAAWKKMGMATLNPDATEQEYVLDIAGQLFRGLLLEEVGHGEDDACVNAALTLEDTGRGIDDATVDRKCDTCSSRLTLRSTGQWLCPNCQPEPITSRRGL